MRAINFFPSQLQWVPVSDRDKDGSTGEILRIGQLVSSENPGNGTGGDEFGTGGVSNHMPAAGVGNITEDVRIAGIVVATNNQYVVRSALANYVGIEQITATVTQATQVASSYNSSVKAFWPENDIAMVQIVRLTPYTKVKVNLYNSTRGTAPTVNTVTTGSTTGAGFTADAADVAGLAGLGSSYFRSGLNRGRMRQSTDTSATVKTFANRFRDDIAIGDKAVSVPLRPFGISYVQLDTEADFFDISATAASNHMYFDVHELHLEKAGEEYVIGTFAPDHFLNVRLADA